MTYSEKITDLPDSVPTIEIPIVAAESCSVLSKRTQDSLAAEFQDKLLAYRIETLGVISECEFDIPNFEFLTRELARCLGRVTPNDTDLQAEVAFLLEDTDRSLRLIRSSSEEAVIVEALLSVCHDSEQQRTHVGKIAKIVNVIRCGRGETEEWEARAMGDKLRAIGIRPGARDSAGMPVILDRGTREYIHRLARKFAVPSIEVERNCSLCV